MIIHLLLFLLGLVMLYVGAEFLVRGSSRLALLARIPPLIIGVTIVAFGTSSPEFLVSFVAAWTDRIDVATGNIIGSNIANIGLIIGLTAVIRPILMADTVVTREMMWMLGTSLVFWFFTMNGIIGHVEGILLFSAIIFFTWSLIRVSLKERKKVTELEEIPPEHERLKHLPNKARILIYVIQIAGGIAVLLWGSEITITRATAIARILGVSEIIIGLSMVAFGTSLPELATSIISIIRRERAIMVGNIIGSNIFNLLFVGGGVASVFTVPFKGHIIGVHIPIMIFFSLLLLPIILRGKQISRPLGILMLALYAGYIVFVYYYRGFQS